MRRTAMILFEKDIVECGEAVYEDHGFTVFVYYGDSYKSLEKLLLRETLLIFGANVLRTDENLKDETLEIEDTHVYTTLPYKEYRRVSDANYEAEKTLIVQQEEQRKWDEFLEKI